MARNADTFADRLVKACDAHPRAPADYGRQAWVRRELARLGSDVSSTAVTNWFNGYTHASPAMMQKLAQVLGVDVPWLSAQEGDGTAVPIAAPAPHDGERMATSKPDTFDFPVVVRGGAVIHLRGIPLDLTEAEARKVANILLAFAQAQD